MGDEIEHFCRGRFAIKFGEKGEHAAANLRQRKGSLGGLRHFGIGRAVRTRRIGLKRCHVMLVADGNKGGRKARLDKVVRQK